MLKKNKLKNLKNNKIKFLYICCFFIYLFKLLKIHENNQIKVCLCTLGKNENKYARQFVEHYKNLDVDKIFIYDNNDIFGENFEEVIKDYIDSDYVEILNWRGKTKQILNITNDCYEKNNMNYDWLIFYEFDEFIFLKNFTSLKTYLSNNRFNDCKKICLNWVLHTDNNLLYYDNRPLSVRFPERELKARGKRKGGLSIVKSIIRGRIKNMTIKFIHTLSENLDGCDGFGKKIKLSGMFTDKSDYEYYYIDHYSCKSTEEFINKVNKGCALFSQDKNYKLRRIKDYFDINKITLEKIKMIETFTDFNLSEYKEKIITYVSKFAINIIFHLLEYFINLKNQYLKD